MRTRPGDPMVPRWDARVLAACAVIAGAALSHAAPARAEDMIAVRGAITDASGAPVPAHTVRLLKARTIVDPRTWRARDQDVEEVRVRSDAHGFFEIQCPVDSEFRRYYLRFYDPGTFDAVKYILPEDREISRRVRQQRAVRADLVLRLRPEWPKVKEMIDVYGPASPCGQVVRALGLPGRRLPQGDGRELWDYPAAGVSYLVLGTRILETRRALRSADLNASGVPAAPAERLQERP